MPRDGSGSVNGHSAVPPAVLGLEEVSESDAGSHAGEQPP